MPVVQLSEHVFLVGGKVSSHPLDCNVYLIDGRPQECVLVDSGTGLGVDVILQNVKEAGIDLGQVSAVVNTHCHYRHAGGNFQLNKRLGYAEVIIHELDAMAVETGDSDLTGANRYGEKFMPCQVNVRVCTSDMEPMKTLGFGDRLWISAGDFELATIHAPGHTPGSMCLYGKIDGRQMLFAGDVGGQLRKKWGSNGEDWRSSILNLLQLKIDCIFSGHDVVTENPREWFENLLSKEPQNARGTS
jgi:glyoxylase-like metal-dependent hydrolase (beta-lactamase superfamily II)